MPLHYPSLFVPKLCILSGQAHAFHSSMTATFGSNGLFFRVSLSLLFYQTFSRWTWVSRYQNVSILDFVGDKDDGSGGDNRSNKTSNRHHQQTNIQFLQAVCPSCRPTNSVKALKGNLISLQVRLVLSKTSNAEPVGIAEAGFLTDGRSFLSSNQQCQSTGRGSSMATVQGW